MPGERPFSGPFAPSGDDLARCVHCGLCLQHCPTYVETGLETESPRGRIYLMKALVAGRVEATPNVIGHLDMCLQCRNCEAVCPSGVAYGRIMEDARASLMNSSAAPPQWRARAAFLREVIARPARLRLLTLALRLYGSSGLRGLAERAPLVRDRALLWPAVRGRPFTRTGVIARPPGAANRRVAFLTGCVMPLAFGRVHRATVRVLARNGCEVVAPAGQVCCGALHAHSGDRTTAMTLARRNVDAFLGSGADAVVVNSAGCGAAMKEYGHLLSTDPAYREKAVRLAAMVRDIHEFLVEIDFEPPRALLDIDITYQDSCHLAHAQRITQAPRQVLAAIPGIRLIEMENADRCCGSAGVYAMTQPEMSLQLLDSKMKAVSRTGASVIATANPGCMMQLEAGLRRHGMDGRVVHVIELLDRAYRREGRPPGAPSHP